MNEGFVGIIPNKTRVIIVYPTVNPDVVVIPIVTSIFVFPVIALLIICCLKKRAARARQKARLAKRDLPYGEQSCASVARFSPPNSSTNHGGGTSSGYHSGRRYTNIDMELTTTVEIVTPDS